MRLSKGQLLQIVLPAADRGKGQNTSYGVQPADSPILVAVGGSVGLFNAAADGVAKVQVIQEPICLTGQVCTAHVLLIGSVTVTVAG